MKETLNKIMCRKCECICAPTSNFIFSKCWMLTYITGHHRSEESRSPVRKSLAFDAGKKALQGRASLKNIPCGRGPTSSTTQSISHHWKYEPSDILNMRTKNFKYAVHTGALKPANILRGCTVRWRFMARFQPFSNWRDLAGERLKLYNAYYMTISIYERGNMREKLQLIWIWWFDEDSMANKTLTRRPTSKQSFSTLYCSLNLMK